MPVLKVRESEIFMIDKCYTCEKNYETCDAYDGEYTLENGNITTCRKYLMSEKEAKTVILNDPYGNIAERMEAIAVARSVLGEDCTMEEIWRWAES